MGCSGWFGVDFVASLGDGGVAWDVLLLQWFVVMVHDACTSFQGPENAFYEFQRSRHSLFICLNFLDLFPKNDIHHG